MGFTVKCPECKWSALYEDVTLEFEKYCPECKENDMFTRTQTDCNPQPIAEEDADSFKV